MKIKLDRRSFRVFFAGPEQSDSSITVGSGFLAPGDTLYSIGQRFGVPWEILARVNNAQKLEPGQKLIIPGLAPAPQPPAAPTSPRDFAPGECVLNPSRQHVAIYRTLVQNPSSGLFSERGLRQALWSNIASVNIISSVYPGAIVLSHDGGGDRTRTVEAYKWTLAELSSQGYVFKSIYLGP